METKIAKQEEEFLLFITGLKAVLGQYELFTDKGPFSMDYRKRKSNTRDVYSTQDTSRMGTTRVKQE